MAQLRLARGRVLVVEVRRVRRRVGIVGPRNDTELSHAMTLAENLVDLVTGQEQDWPEVAAQARELAQLVEGSHVRYRS